MAFPVVASSGTGGAGDGNNATAHVTKPTGLAVDDLLIAIVSSSTISTSNGAGITPTESWNQLDTYSPNANIVLTSYWKIADSSDVALTYFTFTGNTNSSANQCVGTVVRITGADTVTPIQQHASGGATSTASMSSSGVTPVNMQCLLLQLVAGASNTAKTVSSYAIATSNPSWTEQVDFSATGTNDDGHVAVAYANWSVALSTATGNATATYSGSVNGGMMNIIAIQPPKFSTSPTTSIGTIVTPTLIIKTIQSAISSTTSIGTAIASAISDGWSNVSKTVSTWANQNKS